MYKLPWGFYRDSWLIDPMPDTFEIRVEEHPQGISLVPDKLTLYFGANPLYLWGTGKLYHEVIFSEYGFMVIPYFLGRPGFELINSIKFSLAEETDWLGNPIGPRVVGRSNIDKMTKTYLKQIYNIGLLEDKETVKQNDLSSELVNADDDLIKKQYEVGYTPIYENIGDFLLKNDVKAFIPMNIVNGEVIETISKQSIPIITPYSKIYVTQGVYENVISLKTSKLEVTEYINKMFEDERGFQICFKTNPNFRSGTIIDYGTTMFSDLPNYGLRISVYKTGVEIIINDGNVDIKKIFVPRTMSFLVANSFFIKVMYNDYIEIKINDETYTYKMNFNKPQFRPDDKAYISGYSITNENLETGDIAELGFFGSYVDPEFKDKYLAMEPVFPYPGIPITEDTVSPVFENFTYSSPVKILLPQGTGSKDTTLPNKSYNEIYLGNTNSEVIKTETEEENISPNFTSTYIPIGWNFYKTIGFPDPNFDDKTDFIFMLKKLTSDIHIPLKIDIEFKLPKWWTKDMKIKFSLRMISIGRSLWYSYTKYRTGEWY